MNIGIVTVWFQRGAAYVSDQYRKILMGKHDVFIYARGGENYDIKEEEWNDPRVTRAHKLYSDSWSRVDLKHFESWIKKNSISLVLFNEQKDWEVVCWCKKNGIQTCAYIDYYTRDTIPYFELYDILFCNTKRHFSVFKWHPGARYIPWGTDISQFAPSPDKKNKHNCETLVFFHSAGMGGINTRKGTDLLVEAFQLVQGDCKLIIQSQVGLDSYGRCGDIIVKDPRIEFIHKTVDPPGLYFLGDVYVYPTRLEGIGLTIIEALSSGLPVITTNQAPMNEFVEDGITGKLVSCDEERYRFDNYYWPESICNKESLAMCMNEYVRNRDSVDKMSISARQYVVRNRDWLNNAIIVSESIDNIKPITIENKRLRYLQESSIYYTKNFLRKKRSIFETKISKF